MKILKFVIFTLVIFANCSIDRGLEPIRSNVQGVLTYSGEWPAEPAEIRLVAAKQFPPSGLEDLIIGENLLLDIDSQEYAFYLKPGTYNVVGVAWREKDSVWDILSICGLYFSGTDSLAPGEIVISDDSDEVKDINIHVNRSNAHRITDTKIVGNITFEGAWPDSVLEVRVIATTKFSLFPVTLPTLLDISFSDKIEVGTDSTHYKINTFPGTFVATGVLVFKQNQSLSIDDIFYSGTIGGLNLDPYTVEMNSIADGPDFNIKFPE